jgi:hypothetical protein
VQLACAMVKIEEEGARLRKNLKDRKVLMMKREPKTDRTEVTRSEISMART